MKRAKKEKPAQQTNVQDMACAALKKLGAYEMSVGFGEWRWFGFPTILRTDYYFVNSDGTIKAGATLRTAKAVNIGSVKKGKQ